MCNTCYMYTPLNEFFILYKSIKTVQLLVCEAIFRVISQNKHFFLKNLFLEAFFGLVVDNIVKTKFVHWIAFFYQEFENFAV